MKEDVHSIVASYQSFFGISMTTGYFNFKFINYWSFFRLSTTNIQYIILCCYASL
jgi:hypothetical protein